jgi:hypothetical protein
LIDDVAHLSALFCQVIESSSGFVSYNFNNSLQPDDAVKLYIQGCNNPRTHLLPTVRTIVPDDSLGKPFITFPIAKL